jgi:alkylation response protein AidB-like acyl-CoA dehydrogenase
MKASLATHGAIGYRPRAPAKLRLSSFVDLGRCCRRFSRRYALDRVAFGKPNARHRALAFLIVDMHIAVERTGLLVENAAGRIDAGEEGTVAAASAFVDAVESSQFVGPNAMRILGVDGFMRDDPVEKAMRYCRALGLLGGGLDAAQVEIVRLTHPRDRVRQIAHHAIALIDLVGRKLSDLSVG